MLTQDRVKELFEYSEDGFLVWKSGQRQGKVANCVDKRQGYRRVRIGNKLYKNSRVIFIYHNGYAPSIVDHFDRDKLNDKIENLRPASIMENSWNTNLRSDSKSGFKGVSFSKQKGKWRARLVVNGKKKNTLGFTILPEKHLRQGLKVKRFTTGISHLYE